MRLLKVLAEATVQGRGKVVKDLFACLVPRRFYLRTFASGQVGTFKRFVACLSKSYHAFRKYKVTSSRKKSSTFYKKHKVLCLVISMGYEIIFIFVSVGHNIGRGGYMLIYTTAWDALDLWVVDYANRGRGLLDAAARGVYSRLYLKYIHSHRPLACETFQVCWYPTIHALCCYTNNLLYYKNALQI